MTTKQVLAHTDSSNQLFISSFASRFNEGAELDQICDDVFKKFSLESSDIKHPENLLIGKQIITLATEAKSKHYETYKNTILGKIETAFWGFIELCFGKKHISDITRAELTIENLNSKTKSITDPKEIEAANKKAQIIMARSLAKMSGKRQCFSLGSDTGLILLANPNGNVYELDLNPSNLKGKGGGSAGYGGRHYYRGTLHRAGGQTKEIGILTNLPLKWPTEHKVPDHIRNDPVKLEQWKKDPGRIAETHRNLALISQATHESAQEFSLLNKLDHQGIVSAHDHFSFAMAVPKDNKVTISFTIMDFNELGSLENFMKSKEYKKMTFDQKQVFMKSLLEAVQYLHENGYTHRDIKTKNIVVVKDVQDGCLYYRAILIDFVTCISPDHQESKIEEQAGTMQWLPPEYIAVLNNEAMGIHNAPSDREYCTRLIEGLADHLPEVTTQAMDTWALGLTFFKLMYGQDLMSQMFNYCPDSSYGAHRIFEGHFSNFTAAMSSETPPENPLWKEIWKTIHQSTENLEAWKQIIKPMLSIDPEKRPTAAKSLQELDELILDERRLAIGKRVNEDL